jgi:hypothetical protein
MPVRQLFVLLVALVVAAGPMSGTLSSVQAAGPHCAMAMTDGAEHGSCDHQDTQSADLCFAHCAAGMIDTSAAAAPMPVWPAFAVPALAGRVASRAPPPETTPPKFSAA